MSKPRSASPTAGSALASKPCPSAASAHAMTPIHSHDAALLQRHKVRLVAVAASASTTRLPHPERPALALRTHREDAVCAVLARRSVKLLASGTAVGLHRPPVAPPPAALHRVPHPVRNDTALQSPPSAGLLLHHPANSSAAGRLGAPPPSRAPPAPTNIRARWLPAGTIGDAAGSILLKLPGAEENPRRKSHS